MSLTSRRHLAYGTIKNDPQWNDNMVLHSDREPTSDESSWEDYEAASDDFEIISNEGRPVVPLTAFEYHIRNVAICGKEISSLGSGTDGRNSDIGDIADFSSDEEESKVEQIAGCRIPGCQCEEGIDVMKWNYDDLSESEDSEWEDPGQRSIRESVERYNLDLFEGMTPMTYTPPPRKNRRKVYQNFEQYTPEALDCLSGVSAHTSCPATILTICIKVILPDCFGDLTLPMEIM